MNQSSFMKRSALPILCTFALWFSPACGGGGAEPGNGGSGGANAIGHPLLAEPKGEGESNRAAIEVEGPGVPRANASYAGEYNPSRTDSEYVRCTYGNDPENLGHKRLLVVAGTVGADPLFTLTLRDFDEPGQKTVGYQGAESSEEISFELRTPTTQAPDLSYHFGANATGSSYCWLELAEFSTTRAEGSAACKNLVESTSTSDETVSATVTFECVLSDALSGSGSGGQSGGGGAPSSGGTGGASGGNGSLVGDGPGAPITVEEYCAKRSEPEAKWCDYIEKCCTATDQSDVNFVFPACTFGPALSPTSCVTSLQNQIAGGSVWDGTWALACLLDLNKDAPSPPSACSGIRYKDWSDGPNQSLGFARTDACRQMLTGNRGEGEECDYLADCAPGLDCAESSNGTYICAQFGARGASCLSDTDCASDLVCRQKVLDGVCGEPAPEYGKCLYTSECAEGLGCHGGECRRTVSVGASCEGGEVCEPGSGCNLYGRCVLLAQLGQSCITSLNCNGRCETSTSKCAEICGGSVY